jgi:hypothetical protein
MAIAPGFTLESRATPLRLLSTSDWHLGNGRVPAVVICDRLRTTLFPRLSEIDLLNIGGDVWDTLLSLSDDVNVIIALLIDLLRECDRYGVVVRVLLGTYSHDRGQSSLFQIYHDKCQFTNDLRYINQICLEEIVSLGVRILYLPDDLPYDSSQTCLDVVKEMMVARGWTYVDYVFGHGYFEHMIPTHIPRKPKCLFRIDQFDAWVRRYVCMGHIHQSDFTGKVFYNNSVDRLAHGEENPKGFVLVTDYGDTAKLEFIENKAATKFITLDLSAYTDKDEIGALYLSKVKTLFADGEVGYIRVIHPSAEIRQALRRLTSSHYPNLLYSFGKSPESKIKDSSQIHQKLLDVKSYPVPNRETLPQMVVDFLAKEGQSTLSVERIAVLLESL